MNGIGRVQHGLYILCGSASRPASSQATNKCANTANDVSIPSSFSTSSSSSVSVSSTCSLWHKRLGHDHTYIIKKKEAVSKLTIGNSHQYCIVFPVAKQTKMPFQLSNTTKKSIFKLVHYDIWGTI